MAGRYGLQARSHRRFPRKDRGQEEIKFDESKSRVEHVLEILENVCVKAGVSDAKKIQYLAALIKLLSTLNPRDGTTDLGLRIKEILLCLRIPLLSENGELRCATLRSVRYLIKNDQDVSSLVAVNLHVLIVRIIDLDSDNRNERLQAVKLVKQLLMHGPQCFPPLLVKSFLSLIQKGEKKKDNFGRAGLALLCQLSCQNPWLFVYTGCVRYLRQVILNQELPPNIIESIIACLMRLYNIPWIREDCGLDLSCFVGPFTELRLRGENEKPEDARIQDIRLLGARTALLSLLRSWPGLLHLNSPALTTRPIASLVEVLTLHTHQSRKAAYETRRHVLDIIYKSLNLQVPDWTEEFDVAMQTADPSDPNKQSWKLAEGFVAAEGRDIFPHLSKSRPNLVENHFCLLLSAYLEARLPAALIDVITSSDTVLAVRATVLLGQLLHLVTQLLPREVGAVAQCLPELASYVATSNNQINTLDFDMSKSTRAASAVTALQRLHAMKKLGPRPQSLLLQQAVQFSGHTTTGEGFVGDKLSLPAPTPSSAPQSQSTSVAIENATMAGVKESQVVLNRDPQSWKWEAVMSVLRWPSDGLKRLEDVSNYKTFIKKLVDYYKPSSNMFSRLELATQRTRDHARIGVSLIDFLVSSIIYSAELASEKRGGGSAGLAAAQSGGGSGGGHTAGGTEHDSSVYLDELLADIFVCIKEVISSASAHDCVLSPARISNTACQLYFLFIGRLTSSEQGRVILDKHDARTSLLSLLNSRMDVYLKLVVSCVDYRSVDWRIILSKALSGHSEAGRLYTIRWLGVLARMGAPSFSQYGIELLVEQLKDHSLQVSVAALTVLEEVCDDKMYLEALVAAKSSLLCDSGHKALKRLGPRGRVLLTRFLGSSSGFSVMMSLDWLKAELAHWADTFNNSFVLMVEGLLNDCFTQHQRSLDGFGVYGRPSSGDSGKDLRHAYVPPHLYGQLAQTCDGFDVLLKEATYWKMIETVKELESTKGVMELSVRGTGVPAAGASLLSTGDAASRHHKKSACGSEETWLEYKAAIWALSSVATSTIAVGHLEKHGVILALINIAEQCTIISLKGTAFYALGLVATTREGAFALGVKGWATLRHSRSDTWPIAYDWWQSPEDCLLEQQQQQELLANAVATGGSSFAADEAAFNTSALEADDDNILEDSSWIVEDDTGSGRPTLLVEESSGQLMTSSSRDSSTIANKVQRRGVVAGGSTRKKTTSECTSEDSVISSSSYHHILEIGPSPTEPPLLGPPTSKLTEKISNWFSGSSNNGTTITESTTARSEPKNSSHGGVPPTSRRFSDGGSKFGSSIAKLRNSFRRRSKTMSSGYTPPESSATPVSSVGGGAEDQSDVGGGVVGAGGTGGVRKLSFSRVEEGGVSVVGGGVGSSGTGSVIPASPDTLPGEIFSMEKILEEPTPATSSTQQQAHQTAPTSSRLATTMEEGHRMSYHPHRFANKQQQQDDIIKKGGSVVRRRRTESEGADSVTGLGLPLPFMAELDSSPGSSTRQLDVTIRSTSSSCGNTGGRDVLPDTEPLSGRQGRVAGHGDIAGGDQTSGDQQILMNTSITSSTSITEAISKDTGRVDGTMILAFSATKHDVHTNIKPGTSASSVSSYGSLGYSSRVYDPYGLGSLARSRIKKRPQLSESEDGDHSVVSGSGMTGGGMSHGAPPTSLSRQDSKTWTLDYRILRNPNLGISKRLSVAEPSRLLTQPQRPYIQMTRSEKEPAYWGIVFPLDSRKLYLPDSSSSSRSSSAGTSKPASPRSTAPPPLDIMMMPVMMGTWLGGGATTGHGTAGGGGSSTCGTLVGRHSTTTCLSCCRLQPSARPRAASLSITKDDIRSSLLLSGSLPPSHHQSPDVKRKSWNPSLSSSNNQLIGGQETGDNLPTESGALSAAAVLDPSISAVVNIDAAKAEALEFICQLNSLRFSQQAETGLNKLRSRVPRVFQDLCFYSDVCALLAEHDYRANARKFIHQLFTPVNSSQMEIEAKNIIYPASKPTTTSNLPS